MSVIGHRDILSLEIRGQRFDLLIPDVAEGFKRMHLSQPGFEYEPLMTALLDRMIKATERPHLLDIGAFIGYYSVLAGKMIGKRGHVWAIESNRRHVDIIREELELNQLDDVDVVHTALADCSELVRAAEGFVPLPAATSDNGATVTSESCDDMCKRLGVQPNIIKIDVHGFEGRILRGMKEVLSGPVDYLLLELHPKSYLDKVTPSISRLQIIDWLNEAGLNTYYVPGHHIFFADICDTGRFAYQPITNETRGTLMFDNHIHVLIAASRQPLEDLIGPSL
jgi:FkbM family methyltransferase